MDVSRHFVIYVAVLGIALLRAEAPGSTSSSTRHPQYYYPMPNPDVIFKHIYVQILKGNDGVDGPEGHKGTAGANGHRGDPGPFGEMGYKGSKGFPGDKGDQGYTGGKGPKGLKGYRGEEGDMGESYGGATYTRWGHTECPDVPGTRKIYDGVTAGSLFSRFGGGANYVCLPQLPAYLSEHSEKEVSGLYGTEYQQSFSMYYMLDKNVPCVVCYTYNRTVLVMIPAVVTCPPEWIREYAGYLMTEKEKGPSNKVYECVDEDAQALPGSLGNNDGALFFPVVGSCTGLPCPPYKPGWQITCVVCTKDPEIPDTRSRSKGP